MSDKKFKLALARKFVSKICLWSK